MTLLTKIYEEYNITYRKNNVHRQLRLFVTILIFEKTIPLEHFPVVAKNSRGQRRN